MLFGLHKQKGFTLLELLIVVVIIGILLLLVLPNLIAGPARARDARRKADLRSIKDGLEQYYNDNSNYPAALSALTAGSAGYIPSVPQDPKTGKDYTYTPAPAGGPTYSSYTVQTTLEYENDKDIKSNANNSRTYEITSSQ
jgi:general secretion pathway protein G